MEQSHYSARSSFDCQSSAATGVAHIEWKHGEVGTRRPPGSRCGFMHSLVGSNTLCHPRSCGATCLTYVSEKQTFVCACLSGVSRVGHNARAQGLKCSCGDASSNVRLKDDRCTKQNSPHQETDLRRVFRPLACLWGRLQFLAMCVSD